MIENYLFVEKYRPKTIEDCILPNTLKKVFQQFVDKKQIPNLILAGSSGMGKTTVARAMCDEIGADYIIINASMNGNIDTLRNEIQNFATSISFKGTKKFVILDEADYANPHSFQPSLRNFMEEFSNNCGFILTCNHPNKIIPALHSRASLINFKIEKSESAKLSSQFMKRASYILDNENIKYDKNILANLIMRFYPDWRRVLNELQAYAVDGEINTGILANYTNLPIKVIYEFLKNKQFDDIRKWLRENDDIEYTYLFRQLFDESHEYVSKRAIPILVLKISEYQYKAAFVADQEINLLAFFVELMKDLEFV